MYRCMLLTYTSVVNSVPAFRVKLGANDLNCVDVPLNPTHSLYKYIYYKFVHKVQWKWEKKYKEIKKNKITC